MKLIRFLAAAWLVVVSAGLLGNSLFRKHAGFQKEVFVDIPKGTSSRALARKLADAGVVHYQYQFLLTRAVRPTARLKAGEYLFRQPASPWEVFDRIARGDVFYYELRVPEGENIFDVAASLQNQGIMPAEEFLHAARDPSLVRDLAPKAPTLEGYLFPDTYRLTRHTTAQQLCQQMTERFRKAWQHLGSPRTDVQAAVTLASMVEKEAKLPEERTLIASVFLNRLRREMPLQSDPTTIYAALLEDRYRGTIHRSDLESKQRYNTYQHAGLPPGPIANPGLASLRAVLGPAQTDYLYFVLRPDGSGAHQFSRELAAHERAVKKYRRGLNQTNQTRATAPVPGPKPPKPRHGSRVAGPAGSAGANF